MRVSHEDIFSGKALTISTRPDELSRSIASAVLRAVETAADQALALPRISSHGLDGSEGSPASTTHGTTQQICKFDGVACDPRVCIKDRHL